MCNPLPPLILRQIFCAEPNINANNLCCSLPDIFNFRRAQTDILEIIFYSQFSKQTLSEKNP
jgi:hypothetical protein